MVKKQLAFFLVVLCGIGFLNCKGSPKQQPLDYQTYKTVQKREAEFRKKREQKEWAYSAELLVQYLMSKGSYISQLFTIYFLRSTTIALSYLRFTYDLKHLYYPKPIFTDESSY